MQARLIGCECEHIEMMALVRFNKSMEVGEIRDASHHVVKKVLGFRT